MCNASMTERLTHCSFVPQMGAQIAYFGKKTVQVHLIIIRELHKRYAYEVLVLMFFLCKVKGHDQRNPYFLPFPIG